MTIVRLNWGMRKYKNKRTGHYASQREANRAAELRLLADAGKIIDLKEQPRFLLVPPGPGEHGVYYVADFSYNENGKLVVEDVKGMRTSVYKLKRKLMKHLYGIEINEI